MSWKTIAKVSDFYIKIVMLFATILVLVSFTSISPFIFSILTLLFIIAIIFTGLGSIFGKDKVKQK